MQGKAVAAAGALIVLIAASLILFSGRGSEENDVSEGAKLFAANCVACHGLDGEGSAAAPALRGNLFVKLSSPEKIKETIRNGRLDRGMPSWQNFTEEQLASIAAYVKSLS